MKVESSKIYTWILEISIAAFTIALVWFAFVYYPKVVASYKTGVALTKKSIYKPVFAQSNKFPIETSTYRLLYDNNAGIYYAFIQGHRLDEFLFNRDNAKLALKTALSVKDLCDVGVFYVSVEKLDIPKQYKENISCR